MDIRFREGFTHVLTTDRRNGCILMHDMWIEGNLGNDLSKHGWGVSIHQCAYFFSHDHALEVAGFVHVEYDDGQVVFLA